MTVTIVQSLPEATWRQFVEAHPYGNVYHTPEMFRAFAATRRHRPELWAAVEENHRPLALLLPVQVTVLDGPFRPLATRAIVYGGALCEPGATGEAALSKLLALYRRRVKGMPLFTELRNMNDVSSLKTALAAVGFTYESHLNYLIDLSQPETILWKRLSKSCQQSVRTSRNKGVTIEKANEPVELDKVYALLKLVYKRARVPLAHPSLFAAALASLGTRDMFQAFVARAEGRHLAACLLLAYRQRLIYWYGGLDRAWAAYCPMEGLLWHAIQWGKSHGYSILDLGGAGQPDENYGPRKFKAKFGGELVDWGRNVLVHSAWRLRLSTLGFRVLRRFL